MGFAQDDIKMTQRLTINAGLRYEIFGSTIETKAAWKLRRESVTLGAIPTSERTRDLRCHRIRHRPAGVTKRLTRTWKIPYGDVSPRLTALQLTKNPVIVMRGGYGIYFDRHSANTAETTLLQQPYATLQIVSGAPNGPATLQQPFVPLLLPNSSYPIFSPRTPTSTPFVQGVDPNLKDGKTQEYNLNFQFALAHDYSIEVGYVGTQSPQRPGAIRI